MERRDFIKSSVALATSAALGATPVRAETRLAADSGKARVQQFRTLGKTGLKISDISFGAGKLPSASMILRALDRGINYFDTAPDYGQSETFIGEAIKARPGDREKFFIASKFCKPDPYPGHLPLGSGVADYVGAVEGSLKRLNTDYLDVVFVHAIGEGRDVEKERQRLTDSNMLEAFYQLKQAGKVRFLAVSSHGPNMLEDLLLTAVQSMHYHLIMVAFNFLKFPKVPEVIKIAHQNHVGVIAMKTLVGAKETGIEVGGVPFEHAAFKWVLRHPEVAGLVVTMKSVPDLDLFLGASGAKFAEADQRVLDHYAGLYGNDYCRTGCGDCEPACPHGVDIASILRYQMYFESYGDEKRAMQSYAALEHPAAVCGSCADEACSNACPHGLPVGEKLRAAHRSLSWTV
ncbi:MAG: aldo/keto reductase [Magnetococcales bacterium]|nr:aldo/keto reductase [Magnetococcales bacterium]